MAIRIHIWRWFLAVCAFVLGVAFAAAQTPDCPDCLAYDPFTAKSITAMAEAGDAVSAKALAIDKAVNEAFHHIVHRLVLRTDWPRLPSLDTARIHALTDEIAIERERVGAQSYEVTLSIAFNQSALGRVLAEKGITAATVQAPRMVVLPLAVMGDDAVIWDHPRWREAWERIADPSGLVPFVVIDGDAEDRAYESPELIRGDVFATEMFRVRYRSDALLVAVLRETEGGAVALEAVGDDALGAIDLKRTFEQLRGAKGSVVAVAADWLAAELTERWKRAVVLGPEAGAAAGDPLTSQTITKLPVHFDYRGDVNRWLRFQASVAALPGMEEVTVHQVEGDTVHATIAFAGTKERFADGLNASGFFVELAQSGIFVTDGEAFAY